MVPETGTGARAEEETRKPQQQDSHEVLCHLRAQEEIGGSEGQPQTSTAEANWRRRRTRPGPTSFCANPLGVRGTWNPTSGHRPRWKPGTPGTRTTRSFYGHLKGVSGHKTGTGQHAKQETGKPQHQTDHEFLGILAVGGWSAVIGAPSLLLSFARNESAFARGAAGVVKESCAWHTLSASKHAARNRDLQPSSGPPAETDTETPGTRPTTSFYGHRQGVSGHKNRHRATDRDGIREHPAPGRTGVIRPTAWAVAIDGFHSEDARGRDN